MRRIKDLQSLLFLLQSTLNSSSTLPRCSLVLHWLTNQSPDSLLSANQRPGTDLASLEWQPAVSLAFLAQTYSFLLQAHSQHLMSEKIVHWDSSSGKPWEALTNQNPQPANGRTQEENVSQNVLGEDILGLATMLQNLSLTRIITGPLLTPPWHVSDSPGDTRTESSVLSKMQTRTQASIKHSPCSRKHI